MLLSKRYTTRIPLYLAIATMLVLLVLAWHFYVERVAYYDLAYHLFIYLESKSLFIQNRRFVAIVTQLPTLLAIKGGLPLDAVMRLYSVVFVLYYFGILLICAYWLRNEQVALVVALAFVLLSARAFYWAQSEMPQGLVILLLFYAGISRQAPLQRRFSTLALAALVPVFIFAHPLLLLAFLFLWAYDWLLNRRFGDWAYYGMLFWGLAMYALRSKLIPPGSYEENQMTFVPNLIRYFPTYLSLPTFERFWQLCLRDYFTLPLFLGVLTVFYLRQRNWLSTLRLALVWVSAAGYIFIVCVSYPEYVEPTYLDNLCLPIALFVAVPLALEVLPALERAWPRRGGMVVAGLLAVLLVGRVGILWYRHIPYTAYQQWVKQLLTYTRQFPERKFLMYPDNIDPYKLRAGWPWWAMASETTLISARHSPDSAQTVHVGWNIDELAQVGSKPGVLFGPFQTLATTDMPAAYVRFPATTVYRVLNTAPPLDTAALRPYIEARQQVRLQLLDSLPATWRTGRQYSVRVRISVPLAARPLHSSTRLPHPTQLRTAFLKLHDWPTDVAPVSTPLEVDVWEPWNQTLMVATPQIPGRYTFEVRLVSRDYRDWPVQLRMPIEVR
ncbi:hypothetical protein [Hymenobacter aerophilus]|uniref:hypothetical protein n=1 Tax=Hymenobacter aerophilus TaxID=119644 RepID=UPI00037C9D2A|nr:hypothetical protein [Hymenobacter aerophilus]